MIPVTDVAAVHALVEAAEEHGFGLLVRLPFTEVPIILRGEVIRAEWEALDMGEWMEVVAVCE